MYVLVVLVHDVLQYLASSAGRTAWLLCGSQCCGEPGKRLRCRSLRTDSQEQEPVPCSPPATPEGPPSDLHAQTPDGTP